jgi:hypothetical protein
MESGRRRVSTCLAALALVTAMSSATAQQLPQDNIDALKSWSYSLALQAATYGTGRRFYLIPRAHAPAPAMVEVLADPRSWPLPAAVLVK